VGVYSFLHPDNLQRIDAFRTPDALAASFPSGLSCRIPKPQRGARLMLDHRMTALAAALLLGCGGAEPQTDETASTGAEAGAGDAQVAFWNSLRELCGTAHDGRVVEAPADDTTFAGKELIMHVRTCTDTEIRIPFHVGADRSRTWVLTRTGSGLRLKHDHRHEDGSEDAVTQYGGDARPGGTAELQEFPADEHTASLIPAAATNVWTVEVVPSRVFVYALRREGTDRRFRIEFDLSSEVAVPPAPWGAED
jgi:hypothetical protein